MKNQLWGELAHLMSDFQRQVEGLMGPSAKLSRFPFNRQTQHISIGVSSDRTGKYTHTYTVNQEPVLQVVILPESLCKDGVIGTYQVKGMAEPKTLELRNLYDAPDEAAEIVEFWGMLMRDVALSPIHKGMLSRAWACLLKEKPETLLKPEEQSIPETKGKREPEAAASQGTPMTDDHRLYVLERHDERPLKFEGKVLAAVQSSWHMGRRKTLWVFKTRGGKFVFVKAGESVVPGEVRRNEVSVGSSVEECVSFFGHSTLPNALYARLGLDTSETID